MKVRYFEYNSDQNGEKYIEVSEEKFIKDVMITEGRFYISFGNFVLECSESEYKEEAKYCRMKANLKRHTHLITRILPVCYSRLTAFSLMSASWRCGGLKQEKPLAARGSRITLTIG